jgi:hypothetical protein
MWLVFLAESCDKINIFNDGCQMMGLSGNGGMFCLHGKDQIMMLPLNHGFVQAAFLLKKASKPKQMQGHIRLIFSCPRLYF